MTNTARCTHSGNGTCHACLANRAWYIGHRVGALGANPPEDLEWNMRIDAAKLWDAMNAGARV